MYISWQEFRHYRVGSAVGIAPFPPRTEFDWESIDNVDNDESPCYNRVVDIEENDWWSTLTHSVEEIIDVLVEFRHFNWKKRIVRWCEWMRLVLTDVVAVWQKDKPNLRIIFVAIEKFFERFVDDIGDILSDTVHRRDRCLKKLSVVKQEDSSYVFISTDRNDHTESSSDMAHCNAFDRTVLNTVVCICHVDRRFRMAKR